MSFIENFQYLKQLIRTTGRKELRLDNRRLNDLDCLVRIVALGKSDDEQEDENAKDDPEPCRNARAERLQDGTHRRNFQDADDLRIVRNAKIVIGHIDGCMNSTLIHVFKEILNFSNVGRNVGRRQKLLPRLLENASLFKVTLIKTQRHLHLLYNISILQFRKKDIDSRIIQQS
jgi:hypothetical protein